MTAKWFVRRCSGPEAAAVFLNSIHASIVVDHNGSPTMTMAADGDGVIIFAVLLNVEVVK